MPEAAQRPTNLGGRRPPVADGLIAQAGACYRRPTGQPVVHARPVRLSATGDRRAVGLRGTRDRPWQGNGESRIHLGNALGGQCLHVQLVGRFGGVGDLENARVITVDQEGLVALAVDLDRRALHAEHVPTERGRLRRAEGRPCRAQDTVDGAVGHALSIRSFPPLQHN